MKRTFIVLMSFAAMMVASLGLKAQEIVITLDPGWNWISYPNAESMDIASALDDFVPMEGDIIKAHSGNAQFYRGRWTGAVTHFIPGKGYKYYSNRSTTVSFVFSQPSSSGGGHAYVDLGLPSGTLWATCNVGSSVPYGIGEYFAWGETQPKSVYGWSTYQYCMGGDSTLTKYCNNSSYGNNGFTDNLTILQPGDDAATVHWGADWRMPTHEEWQELMDNTTHSYTTQNGLRGIRFTAANGNSIFLPAAGGGIIDAIDYESYAMVVYTHFIGIYWSSLLGNDSRYAMAFAFAEEIAFGEEMFLVGQMKRVFGFPIRPVRATQPNVYNILVSANPPAGGTVTGGGTFMQGASCTVSALANSGSGYSFNGWMENGTVVSTSPTYTFTVSASRNLVASFLPPGSVNGKFSVSGSKQVFFSSGNLQYKASTNTWRFAPAQYDYIGSDNANMSSTYSGWIDLFGWGTSNYNHGATAYQPWSTSTSNSYYRAYGSIAYNLYDQTGKADWGYNAISNGGNQTNKWRTLSREEWEYVLNTRTTSSGIRYAKATVNNVSGVILVPDDWSTSYYSLANTNTANANFTGNTLTATQWNVLEQYGAVFLPLANWRVGTNVIENGWGSYWTSSCYDNNYAYTLDYSSSSLSVTTADRYSGESVRLVRDVARYVDLGTGTLWATCNVGASSPEEFGTYFAWAETQSKSSYSWSTYRYCNGGSSYLTKYCTNANYGNNGFTDNLTVLQPGDDPATANWGSEWRTPTDLEWMELYFECIPTWTTQNGVNGLLFIGNGNSLFVPAAGYRYIGYLDYAGSLGRYWTNSIDSNDPRYGNCFCFDSNAEWEDYSSFRCNGYSVRPVHVSSKE